MHFRNNVNSHAQEYQLISIISNYNNSTSINEGHYTCSIKRNGWWWNYDDEHVSKSTNIPEYTKTHCYLLIYKRNDK